MDPTLAVTYGVALTCIVVVSFLANVAKRFIKKRGQGKVNAMWGTAMLLSIVGATYYETVDNSEMALLCLAIGWSLLIGVYITGPKKTASAATGTADLATSG